MACGMERTVRAAVYLEIKGGKAVFFHALTFFWEVFTLVPCLLHVFGGSSFFSVKIRSIFTDQIFPDCSCSVWKMADKGNLVILEI